MQNSVLFGIVMTLLNKKIVTRKYLAEKYEVSERTISRYLDTLCAAGIPIYVNYGPMGGFSISEEYKIDKAFFTKEEFQHIITALRATSSINATMNTNIIDKFENLARRKLINADDYIIKNDTLIIDSGSWTNPDKFRNKMETLNLAIYGNKIIEISYIDRYDVKSLRNFNPYALALKEGVWYAYGWCHNRNDFRLFKLSRIKSIRTTDKTFTRVETDVYSALKGHFDPDTAIKVEFEFSSLIYDEIHEWLGEDAISERGTQYVASASLYNGKPLINKLLSFGSSIRVISPKSIRDELLSECQRVLRQAIRNDDIGKDCIKLK